MRIVRSITINAPIGHVFSLFEENKENKFFREDLIRPKNDERSAVQKVQTHSDTHGTTDKIEQMRRKSHFKGELTAYNKPYDFGFRVYSKKAQFLFDINFQETSGGTKVRYTTQTVLSSRFSGLITWFSNFTTLFIIKKQLKHLKQIAES